MSQVFLATSFSGNVDNNGSVDTQFRAGIEGILNTLRSVLGIDVFCALEDENWNITNEPAAQGVKRDLEQLDRSNVLLAMVYDKPSAGVQFEIGYAIAKGKLVIVATEADTELAYFNKGAVGNGMAKAISYSSSEELVQKVSAIIES